MTMILLFVYKKFNAMAFYGFQNSILTFLKFYIVRFKIDVYKKSSKLSNLLIDFNLITC